jgi:hypothetical protein
VWFGRRKQRVSVTRDTGDHRSLFDPEAEVPAWFWERIAAGRQNRDTFRAVVRDMSKEELREFILLFDDLAGWFCDAPFVPPPPARNSENSLQETGYWVVSQGKDYFMRVWEQPELFWPLLAEEVEDFQRERSYSGVAGAEWLERYYPPEDIPCQ